MEDEALGDDFEDHLDRESYREDLANRLEPLVVLRKVVSVLVIVDRQDNGIGEDEENDKVLEHVRACERHKFNPDSILEVKAE